MESRASQFAVVVATLNEKKDMCPSPEELQNTMYKLHVILEICGHEAQVRKLLSLGRVTNA